MQEDIGAQLPFISVGFEQKDSPGDCAQKMIKKY